MILNLFLIWRIAIFVVTFVGSKTFPLASNGGIGAISQNTAFDFWKSWAQWDGGHFYNIAKLGYFAPKEFAFFPLYPYAIKFVSFFLLGNTVLAGLLISNLAAFLFLYFFYHFIKTKFSKNTAAASIITFILFPTAYFLLAMYSESIFLLFVILFFSKLGQKKYFQSAIFAGLASTIRLVGILLPLILVVDLVTSPKKTKEKILGIFVSFLPFFAYCMYLYKRFGDPLYFLTSETSWQRTLTSPVSTISAYILGFDLKQPFVYYLDVFLPLVFIAILLLNFKKIPRTLWFFSLLVILVPVSSGTLTSMPRYLLASIGAFIIVGNYLEDKKIRYVAWFLSALCQAALAIMFVNGYWTA